MCCIAFDNWQKAAIDIVANAGAFDFDENIRTFLQHTVFWHLRIFSMKSIGISKLRNQQPYAICSFRPSLCNAPGLNGSACNVHAKQRTTRECVFIRIIWAEMRMEFGKIVHACRFVPRSAPPNRFQIISRSHHRKSQSHILATRKNVFHRLLPDIPSGWANSFSLIVRHRDHLNLESHHITFICVALLFWTCVRLIRNRCNFCAPLLPLMESAFVTTFSAHQHKHPCNSSECVCACEREKRDSR